NRPDQERWARLGHLETRGASNPGVAASIAAFNEGEVWLDAVIGYLDDSRTLLGDLLNQYLPQVRYRQPEGTYLAWLNCAAMDLPGSPGTLVIDRAHVTVVDGPDFGDGGAGAFRFNFATPQPILTEMVERIATALSAR
ncbi:MAG: aminotransferase class I/II, partial [Actinobacteria bacterium]|nr:aminotransferase class I/II [Actinomycetota bacterium]